MARPAAEQLQFESTRQRLMFSIPELKGALCDECYRTVDLAAEAVGHRIGCAAKDFDVLVFAGAVTGAMMAALDSAPMTAWTGYRAPDFPEAGMPLS